MANTILIKGRGLRKEATASGTVKPGNLLQLTTDGKVKKHAAAGTTVRKAFAVEDELHGKEISESYASGDNVVYEIMSPGAEVLCLLAPSNSVVIGDFVESGVGGTVRKVATDANTAQNERCSVVGVALEAVANTSTTQTKRLIIEVM